MRTRVLTPQNSCLSAHRGFHIEAIVHLLPGFCFGRSIKQAKQDIARELKFKYILFYFKR